jgi:hypothetical protein
MYYSHPCSYCGKIFYTYSNDRESAAKILYHGIKSHLITYGEDHKEYEFDEDPEVEVYQMLTVMVETSSSPAGGHELP